MRSLSRHRVHVRAARARRRGGDRARRPLGRRTAGTAHTAANPQLLLGVTNNTARFQTQTGQVSSVDQAFVGWGQGQTYGAPFAQLFDSLGPIPMLHLGTGGGPRNPHEVITPQAIAQGKGDSYLVALNHAIASWGKGIYIRPMGEMNNPGAFYSGYDANGAPKDAAHAPAEYRAAFARIYVILHGGNDRSRQPEAEAARPSARPGRRPAAEPVPAAPRRLEPAGRLVGARRRQRREQLLPRATRTSTSRAATSTPRTASRRSTGSRRSTPSRGSTASRSRCPEAGLTDNDDPAFVNRLCTFVNTRPATELFAYYESKPGSRWDMGNKPQSRGRVPAVHGAARGDAARRGRRRTRRAAARASSR